MHSFSFRHPLPFSASRRLPTVRFAALSGAVVLALTAFGCGGGSDSAGGGGADGRDAIVGTWSGAATLSSKAAGPGTYAMTYQILKGAAAGAVHGSYQINVLIGGKPILLQFGTFAGTLANSKVTGTVAAGMDKMGLPLAALQANAGDFTLNIPASRGRIDLINAISSSWNVLTQTWTSSASQTSTSSTANLNLKGTTWVGDPTNTTNPQGLNIQVPDKDHPGQLKSLGLYALKAQFTDQSADNLLTGKFSGSLPGGKDFSIDFKDGTITGKSVKIVAKLPPDAPAIEIPTGGGQTFSLPMAGRTFGFSADVNGNTMGGANSIFALHLDTGAELLAATLFGVKPLTDGSDGWFVFGATSLTKSTGTQTTPGGIIVPIQ